MAVARKVKVWTEPTEFARFIKFVTFGTLGEQDSDAVAITGGTMSGLTGSVAAAIAAAGSVQGDATALAKVDITEVATVGADEGVILPAGVVGDSMFVYNGGANALDVYPQVASFIDAAAEDAPLVLGTDEGITFYAVTTTLWVTNK